MPSIRKSALVAHSDAQMFTLVDDIKSYPQFLPWCSSADLTLVEARAVEATIGVDFLGLKLAFSTRNLRHAPTQIDISLLGGPFRRFAGQWKFTALAAQACKIEFHLDYQVQAGVIGAALAPVFEQIASTMVDAFVRRAEQLYG